MTHVHSSHVHSASWRELPHGFADHLELEAGLSAPVTQAALDTAVSALRDEPGSIIDLGSGTGAGTVALALRFPRATVHAVDVSPELQDRVRGAAERAGVTDRIVTHTADLDGDWPAVVPDGADLVWAALSLHHVSDPAATLRQAFAVLRPDGALVVTEMVGEPIWEPSDLGSGRDGLAAALSDGGRAGAGAVDWRRAVEEAGFSAVQHRDASFTVSARTSDGSRYLQARLRSHRDRLAGTIPAEDLAALDAVTTALDGGTSGVSSTHRRAIWVATRAERVAPREAEGAAADQIEAEVIVVGGGAAGLAAAVALARSRRDVVVIDAGEPRNAPAEGAHNVLGHEGMRPRELLARGRAEAEAYGVRILRGRATGASGRIDDFGVEVNDGATVVHGRRVILATGLVDELPAIPGVKDAWGRTVLHCPFCHGWEVRDQRIAIIAGDDIGVHRAMMFRQLSDRVTLFRHEADAPNDVERAQLAALGVPVVTPRVERLVVDGTRVEAVEVEGGERFEMDAVVVAPRFHARTELYEALGGAAETTPFGRQIPADPRGATSVPGVWAAGNASELMAMVVASAAAGVMAGAAVHGDLLVDLLVADLERAVRGV